MKRLVIDEDDLLWMLMNQNIDLRSVFSALYLYTASDGAYGAMDGLNESETMMAYKILKKMDEAGGGT